MYPINGFTAVSEMKLIYYNYNYSNLRSLFLLFLIIIIKLHGKKPRLCRFKNTFYYTKCYRM